MYSLKPIERGGFALFVVLAIAGLFVHVCFQETLGEIIQDKVCSTTNTSCFNNACMSPPDTSCEGVSDYSCRELTPIWHKFCKNEMDSTCDQKNCACGQASFWDGAVQCMAMNPDKCGAGTDPPDCVTTNCEGGCGTGCSSCPS